MQRIEDFVAYVKSRKSASTARAYKRGAERFEKYLASKGLQGSLEGHPEGLLDSYVTWMIESGLSASTVRLMLAGCNAYLEWQRRQGEVIPNFYTPDLPKLKQKEPYALDENELVRYWRACATRPDPVRTILTLLPLCGLRSEEIATLRLEGDVEPKGTWIVLHVIGKGGKRRSVPLLPQGNKIMRQYLVGWRAHTKQDNPFLFPGQPKGDHYHTRSMRRHMKAIREEIDLPATLTPHVLRKTYLTFLDKAGLSPFAIAKLAGHADLKTTHEGYIHRNVDGLIEDLTKVSPMLEPQDS